MTKRTATPDEISEALAMRDVGFTVLSISQKLGIGVRSLQRHFAEHGATKGSLKQAVMESARAMLIQRITSNDVIRNEAASLINDDLAHSRHLRSIMMEASEQLKATTVEEAVLVMRAAAAYSTAIKNTSDTIRHTLRLERLEEESTTGLPELIVRELTPEEVRELRAERSTEEDMAIEEDAAIA